jgi:actin-related protein 9
MFFERFNVAGFTFIERPLASLYAANQISGIVIEIGQDETDYITCFESQLHHGSALSVPVGIRDCERHLASILRTNTQVTNVLSAPPRGSPDAEGLDMLLLALARFLWQNGHCKIPIEGGEPEKDPLEDGNLDIAAVLISGKERALIEAAGTKKKAGQNKAEKEREREMAALDLISISFRDFPPLTVGKERHRFCEPLFDPAVLNFCSIPLQTSVKMDGLNLPTPPVVKNRDFMLPVQGAVHGVVKAAPFSRRSLLYFGIVITGQLANVHGGRTRSNQHTLCMESN